MDDEQKYREKIERLKLELTIPSGPSSDPAEIERRLSETATSTCTRCGNEFVYRKYLDGECATNGWPRIGTRLRCCDGCLAEYETDSAKRQEQALNEFRFELGVNWLCTESGIPSRYQERGFELFKRDLQPEAYSLSGNFLEHLLDDGRYYDSQGEFIPDYAEASLLLASKGNGTGKTHLACAIGKAYIEAKVAAVQTLGWSKTCPVLFVTAPRLFLRIRNTYHDDSEESEGGIIDRLSEVQLLILDDVGKEKPSDHTRQTYYTIVDCRYGANKPMVITSNLVLPDQIKQLTDLMGAATVSRLKEMTEGWRVVMSGADYRFREKKP